MAAAVPRVFFAGVDIGLETADGENTRIQFRGKDNLTFCYTYKFVPQCIYIYILIDGYKHACIKFKQMQKWKSLDSGVGQGKYDASEEQCFPKKKNSSVTKSTAL